MVCIPFYRLRDEEGPDFGGGKEGKEILFYLFALWSSEVSPGRPHLPVLVREGILLCVVRSGLVTLWNGQDMGLGWEVKNMCMIS